MILFQLRTWRLGINSLFLHPMRSLLTVLGIFIGVASVIWLLAISEGISREAQRQIEELGATNVILRSILPVEKQQDDTTFYVKYGIRRDDVAALMKIPTVTDALHARRNMPKSGSCASMKGRLSRMFMLGSGPTSVHWQRKRPSSFSRWKIR